MPCPASRSAATAQRPTIAPAATRVTSLPSRITRALPISSLEPGVCTGSAPARLMRRYTGPSNSATSGTQSAASAPSAATITVMPGSARRLAISLIE